MGARRAALALVLIAIGYGLLVCLIWWQGPEIRRPAVFAASLLPPVVVLGVLPAIRLIEAGLRWRRRRYRIRATCARLWFEGRRIRARPSDDTRRFDEEE